MRALLNLAGILLAALIICAGPAIYIFDRNPNARPLVNLNFLWVHVRWPVSPAARMAMVQADLTTCHDNGKKLLDGLADQNASLAAQSRLGVAALAKSETDLQQARVGLARADQAGVQIMAPLKADEACARAREVDGRLLEALK